MQVPDEVREAARAAFRTRAPGRTLLARVEHEEDGCLPGSARSLCFTSSDLSVHVEVAAGEDGLAHLTVHLRPAMDVEIEVERPDPAMTLVVRGPSPLRLAAAPGGLTRLAITSLDLPARRWHTSWTRL